MRLLALDQAMKTTGYTILENGKFVTCGKWTIDSNSDIEKRLADFKTQVIKVYAYNNCDFIAFEDIQLQLGNVDTYKKLAYCQAMILNLCYEHSIPYMILSPSHWRKIINKKYSISFGRKRVEQKEMALTFAQAHSHQKMTEDMADSYCLALAATEELNKKESAF